MLLKHVRDAGRARQGCCWNILLLRKVRFYSTIQISVRLLSPSSGEGTTLMILQAACGPTGAVSTGSLLTPKPAGSRSLTGSDGIVRA